MKAVFKIAALAVALAVLAVPASALSACWASSPAAPHACCMSPHRPAMAIKSGGVRTCCNISSDRPVPPAQVQAQNNSSGRVVVAPAAAIVPVEMDPAAARSDLRIEIPLKLLLSAQAVLCTFLI